MIEISRRCKRLLFTSNDWLVTAEPPDDGTRSYSIAGCVMAHKAKNKVYVHCDQGSQFTSIDTTAFFKALNIKDSMGQRGLESTVFILLRNIAHNAKNI